jgi:hypothetical protein
MRSRKEMSKQRTRDGKNKRKRRKGNIDWVTQMRIVSKINKI